MSEKTLIASSVLGQGIISPSLSRGADFDVYTDAMRADENAEVGHAVVSMIGSSTTQDLQGDTMTLSALDDMTRVPSDLLCFLNHSYNVPEDVLGGLYGKPYIKSSSGIADLHLSVEVETSNPRAAQTYNMIAVKKRRLGCSIGCQVLDYDIDDNTGGIFIRSVGVLEWSLVGIPAQQRCWVEVATKSLFERALLGGNGDEALKLAPAVKGMFSRSFDSLVKHIASPGLKRDLEHTSARNTVPHRIMTAFHDGEARFALADRKGITKSLSREEVSDLLTRDVLNTTTGGELIRQDLAEKEDDMNEKEKAVDVASDGTHAAMTGTHTHAHPACGAQGDDGKHEHSHEHNDDASHHHSHAEKSVEPDVQKEQEEGEAPETTPELVKEEAPIVPETTPDVQKEAEPAQTQEINPEHLGLLAAYNTIGKQLGFEPAGMGKKSISEDAQNMQQVISYVSEADHCIDQVMMLLGIPDIDTPMGMYSMSVPLQKALTDALTLKAGASISAANKDIIKAMHDHSVATHDLCKAMHPDACKCDSMGNQGTDIANAAQDAEFQMGNANGTSKAYEPLVEAMSGLTDVLKGLDMPAIQSQVNSAQGALDVIKKQLSDKGQELNNLSHTISTLKNAPLGRPTNLNRATVPGEASYAAMKAAGGQVVTKEDILGMTTKKHTPNGIVRHWPASIGVELRPALTDDQKSLMHPYAVLAYQDGEDVDVPTIDEMSA